MKKRWFFLIALFLMFQPTLAAKTPGDDWQPVADGIDYLDYHLTDPNNVYVARMTRSNLGVTIESSIPHGGLSGSLETVSSMASHAEQAINYWGGSFITTTWGARNDVVVAINGSYFDFDTGIMTGGMLHSGWYAKRFDELGGRTGFAWTLNRVPFIGECVKHRPEKQVAVFPDTLATLQISGVNEPRNVDELILYTPQYDMTTLTNDKGVEVLIEMTRPTMLLPEPLRFAQGYVRSIQVNKGDSVIPFDHVVLSASGSMTETLLASVSLGAQVRISQELTSLSAPLCEEVINLSWTKTFASVQGDYYFLKDGEIVIYDDPNALVRNPRTAIAYNDQYVYFIVVDGRDTVNSVGMTIAELAAFTRNTLGATYAVAQDGGGSSTMVVNGEVVNNVYCNNYYCDDEIPKYYSYLPFLARKVTPELLADRAQMSGAQISADYERSVANGMMMVVVEQPEFSATFTVGQPVVLVESAYVFTGPGTNFFRLGSLPAGTAGEVMSTLSGLNGVRARYTNWWRVDFDSLSGWVQEPMLSAR